MKKILMITHSSGGGGAETVFSRVVESLKKKNKLWIAFNSNKGKLVEEVESEKIYIFNYCLQNSIIRLLIRLIFWNSFSILKLLNFVKKEKIDYIYSSSIVSYIGVVVAILTKKNHIWHIHEMDNPGYQWFNPKLNFLIKYFFRKSKIIFISEEVKNSWLKRFKIAEDDIDYEIIYNPIKIFKPFKKSLEKNDHKIKIGCAGYFCENKNQKLLIEVFIKLKKKYKNIELELAGVGVLEGSKAIIQDKLEEKDYHLHDYMDIQKFFDNIDILVVPSFSEAWPLVVFEAMSLDLIPIVTTECSLKEVILDNKNAYFINPFKKNELYKKLEEIILNYNEVRDEIIKNNRILLKEYDFNGQFEKKIDSIFK